MDRALLFLVAVTTACSTATATRTGSPSSPPTRADSTTSTLVDTTSSRIAQPPSTVTTTEAPTPRFVVWSTDGLPEDFRGLVASIERVTASAVVESGTWHIAETVNASGITVDRPREGFVIPVQGVTLDAGSSSPFFSLATARALADLRPDQVVLSASSAALRRLDVGAAITFEDGTQMTVAVILPDSEIGTAEIVAAENPGLAIENSTRRSAILEYDGTRDELEAELRELLGEDAPLRVREPNPGNGGRASLVRSQLFIKQTFGEFAYRPTGRGRTVEIDPDWVAANIVDVEIPLLGRTRCHREFAALLTDVMEDLADDELAHIVEERAFRGCWNPRYISGTGRLSRHAWGVAADINFGNPPDDQPGSPVHPELLRRMAAAGIISGHVFTTPDPGHFEFYGEI